MWEEAGERRVGGVGVFVFQKLGGYKQHGSMTHGGTVLVTLGTSFRQTPNNRVPVVVEGLQLLCLCLSPQLWLPSFSIPDNEASHSSGLNLRPG